MLACRKPSLGVKAKDTGLSREGLYRSLSADGNPGFATILKVVKALGLSLQVDVASPTT